MFVLPFLVGSLIGWERYKRLISGYEWLLGLYAIVILFLYFYAHRGLTWARLQGPVWGERQRRPIVYDDPKEDAERLRRVAEDRPRVAAAVERRDAEFLYRLACEYEEKWYVNEVLDLLEKTMELDGSGMWGAEARAKLREYGEQQ
jgi:hypothetical protein